MSSNEEHERLREQHVNEILSSEVPRKLIVAGPGTGKTSTFKKIFMHGGRTDTLAITFIRNLVAELKKDLDGLADVYTFHGFSKQLLYSLDVDGITRSFDYYPSLNLILADDISRLELPGTGSREIERSIHNLDDSEGLISLSIRSGDYYNAAGYTDSVYRVYKHLAANAGSIPQYSQIVVDEYQDFSLLEVKFIELLAAVNPILIVGDDDQALYGFKHASAIYLRGLAQDPSFTRFELPYCSRCTTVMVKAVDMTVSRAQSAGLLTKRVDKRFECYLPDKGSDSVAFPNIVHARCTVERNNAPYIGKYVHQKILEISDEDVQRSRDKGYPTVLVVGPMEFSRRVYDYISQYLDDVELKESEPLEIRMLDGYKRLLRNQRSRLGWRIVCYLDCPPEFESLLRDAFREGNELFDLLPTSYRDHHLRNVAILRKVKEGALLSQEEVLAVEGGVLTPFLDVKKELVRDMDSENDEPSDFDQEPSAPAGAPRVVVTSLVGAKGLQAEHVFVVGVNDQHFPRSNADISEDEVCCFIVALTRAKRSCTLVSCDRFGNQPLHTSAFLDWIRPYLSEEAVNAEYFRRRATA